MVLTLAQNHGCVLSAPHCTSSLRVSHPWESRSRAGAWCKGQLPEAADWAQVWGAKSQAHTLAPLLPAYDLGKVTNIYVQKACVSTCLHSEHPAQLPGQWRPRALWVNE